MATVVEVLLLTETYLRGRGVESPRLDAELLIGHVLHLDRVALYLRFDQPLLESETSTLRGLVARRGHREPMAWILGTKAFYRHDFQVDAGVLVPRPDTETLVEEALRRIPPDADWTIADVGTGSGAIGLSILAERPACKLFAIDPSTAALQCTKTNATRMGLRDRVATLRGEYLGPVPNDRPIDVIVSNPPYIPTGDIEALAPEVRVHEPRLALDGGPDGLDAVRGLLARAIPRAKQFSLIEIGHDQGEAATTLVRAAGWQDVGVIRDLGQRDRVLFIARSLMVPAQTPLRSSA